MKTRNSLIALVLLATATLIQAQTVDLNNIRDEWDRYRINQGLTKLDPTWNGVAFGLYDSATQTILPPTTFLPATTDAANAVTRSTNAVIFEGATADAYETSLKAVDPTADQVVWIADFAVNNALMSSTLVTNTIAAANSIWFASNSQVFEGATADAFETTLTPVDPTADQTVSIANAGVNNALMFSTLTTNTVGAANSIWFSSNTTNYEGATADAFEITVVPADPTADVVYTWPDAAAGTYSVMSSTLATNAPNIANSVTGASASLVFEGTADGFETTLTSVDPTADQTVSIANAGVNNALVFTTLTTNTIDAANSIWLASNAVVMEGATADAFETTIAPTDATADRTITLPDATGTIRVAQASTAVSLTADNQAVTPGSANVLQLASDNATDTNRTFTLSATGAITGAIYVIIGPATNGCEIADTGIQVLSATWSPTTGDTLTLLFDGTNFIELGRANN